MIRAKAAGWPFRVLWPSRLGLLALEDQGQQAGAVELLAGYVVIDQLQGAWNAKRGLKQTRGP